MAAGAPAVIIGADLRNTFVPAETGALCGAPNAELATLSQVERLASIKIGDLSMGESWNLPVRNILATLVPLSGGASGAVLVFRAAAQPLEDTTPRPRAPRLDDVMQTVMDRFAPFADLKGIRLQIDAPDFDEHFRDHIGLTEAIGVLVDNSLHYVMPGGQIVAGYRVMDHKGKPLLLFFVMDSGPVVPDHMRHVIFEPGFVWNPSLRERTGRSLSRVRDFAVKHGGSVWAEAKTGKACTFFLRVRPDGAR
jgi:signal transduction histidine kinase